jgi:hypothetical protein
VSGTIAVIVVSFNRPRMLAECLASIGDCDQVVLADDGSDFDVRALAERFNLPNLTLVLNNPKPPAHRMVEPSCGKLMNRATRAVACDYLIPVCDDDLLAEDWPRAAAAGLDYYRDFHMCRGDWRTFSDGEDRTKAPLCRFHFSPPLTTGNYAYRLTCATEEGCWWSERSLAVHDSVMLTNYINVHRQLPNWYGALDVLAGWRREHPKTISNNATSSDRYAPRVAEMFAAGAGGME